MEIQRKTTAFITVIISVLLLTISASAEDAILFAPGKTYGETVFLPEKENSPDELLNLYINSLFGIYDGRQAKNTSIEFDDEVMKGIHKILETMIIDVSQEMRLSTVLEVSFAEVSEKLTWTADELGVGEFTNDNISSFVSDKYFIDMDPIFAKLRADHPYEFFWTDGNYYWWGSYYYSIRNETLELQGTYTFAFPVAEEFSDGTTRELYGNMFRVQMKEGVTAGAVRAAENAKMIIKDYAGLSDYQKLVAYKNKICSLVDYNSEAWHDGQSQVPYGNPWQLVWVFDNDPATKVVCEGYSRAFQYLCDKSTFIGDVSCICVGGWVYTSGNGDRHMWNIVHMNDGYNYQADITWCDGGWNLFLVGYSSNPNPDTYSYQNENVTYIYDDYILDAYYSNQLVISGKNYNPANDIISFSSHFTLPASLLTIESEAFADVNTQAVYIPSTVSYIAPDAFPLSTVIIAPKNSYAAEWAKEHGYKLLEE